MGQTLSAEDCLRQAGEYIQLAETCSDAELRKQYLKIAGELTVLAAALDSSQASKNPAHDAEPVAPQKGESPWEQD